MSRSIPPDHLVVFGRPGSGKSSLAERLGAEFGYQLVRTGEMLREAMRRDDFLGKRVEVHVKSGNLVPDGLIFELLELNLKSPGTTKLLFDGFPRTIGQVELLERFEKKLGFGIDCYLDVVVSREAAVARMTGRRICPTCGATYHLLNKPPRVDGVCDIDATPLVGRPDDTPEVVQLRQQIYDENAEPILRYYREHFPDRVVAVDGEQPFEEVYRSTRETLGLKHG